MALKQSWPAQSYSGQTQTNIIILGRLIPSFGTTCHLLSQLRIYDPLGFLPLLFQPKEWYNIYGPCNLTGMSRLLVIATANSNSNTSPRYFPSNDPFQLHRFIDTWLLSYAHVAYFRVVKPKLPPGGTSCYSKIQSSTFKSHFVVAAIVLFSDLVLFVLKAYRSHSVFEDAITWSDSKISISPSF